MKSRLVIDRDLLARFNVAQSDEENVTVQNLHVGVRFTGMIDIVGSIAPATSVQTPALINRADAQLATTRPAIGFGILDPLAGILRYFSSAFEMRD
ncbi:MAG TPA: hypothetical protein VMS31_12725 [Pyrinomonadaceae bacterium]|nr:hypothetical protein [Pyrinomonadaceae bacterium]